MPNYWRIPKHKHLPPLPNNEITAVVVAVHSATFIIPRLMHRISFGIQYTEYKKAVQSNKRLYRSREIKRRNKRFERVR